MCGIAGILQFTKKADRALFKEMTEIISHRGPDDEGYLFANMGTDDFVVAGGSDTPSAVFKSNFQYSPSLNIDNIPDAPYNLALSNRRLAILDPSPAGHQPMSNEDKSLWIVHNGEIYNFKELRDELKAKGYKFITDSDTEVIIKAYEEWDVDCLNKLNGMWAFCIWDVKKKILFCSRDRFGIKPFYYYHDENVFAFSSEIKSLIQLDIQRRPNDKLVYDFLKFGILDHTDEVFFKDIKKLSHAHYLIIKPDGHLTIKRYWDFEVSNEIGDGFGKSRYAEDFLDIFIDAVKLRLRSDVPVGSCLSGGLDSSAIVCVANNLSFSDNNLSVSEWQKTFSSCFDESRFDEREYIREVTKQTQTEENFVFPKPDELLKELNYILWHQEEPFGGSSIYAQWCVMKKAKEKNIKVMLDGQGADEQLAGYRKFIVFYLFELLKKKRCFRLLFEFISFFSSFELLKTLNVREGARYFNLGNKILGIDELLLDSFNSRFIDENLNFGYQGNLGKRIKEDLCKFSLPVLLRYEDKNSMAHSVESRLPFLDYRLVEKLAAFPLMQKMRNGWSKYVLRNAMIDILPEKIRSRKSKLGFVTPEDIWFGKDMSQFVKSVFNDSVFISNYVHKEKLVSSFERYLDNKSMYKSNIFFRFFILELWGRQFKLEL